MKTTSLLLNGLLWIAVLELPFCLPAQEKPVEDAPVASVNGSVIRDADLKIGPKLKELEQQAYELRLEALQEVIEQRLLEQEAAKTSTTVEDLLAKNVEAKTSAPSPEEVGAFYEQQKSRINKPLDEIRPQLEEFLKGMKRRDARSSYLAALRKAGNVKIMLQAPRAEVEIGNSPQRGPAEAPVTIVEFSDFQCPFCRRAQPTLGEIQEKYPGKVRFVYKDLPLREIHPQAQTAAEAAHCAGDQGKYWEYQKALFSTEQLSEGIYPKIASSLQLDPLAFQGCLDSGKHEATVNAGFDQAVEVGANSTPTFFVNGIKLSGAQPLENFAQIIDAELAAQPAP
jgi:protein-disulfide isomerase